LFQQSVTEPTRYSNGNGSILDLALCNVPDLILGTEVVPGVSDHLAVKVTLKCTATRMKPVPREVYNFRLADWNKLNAQFSTLPINFDVFSSVDEAWSHWLTYFLTVLTLLYQSVL
jgi:gamma-glutamyl phosphate reductase